jgi:hypothetical protein
MVHQAMADAGAAGDTIVIGDTASTWAWRRCRCHGHRRGWGYHEAHEMLTRGPSRSRTAARRPRHPDWPQERFMADEDSGERRFHLFMRALFGLATFFLGFAIIYTDLLREGGWPTSAPSWSLRNDRRCLRAEASQEDVGAAGPRARMKRFWKRGGRRTGWRLGRGAGWQAAADARRGAC